MKNLDNAALRQLIYVCVAAGFTVFGVDAAKNQAGADAWTDVIVAVIGIVPMVIAAMNVRNGKGVSPQNPLSGPNTDQPGVYTPAVGTDAEQLSSRANDEAVVMPQYSSRAQDEQAG